MMRIEAMADAIMHYEGWMPGSISYRNRNPGNLRGSALKSGIDKQGYAVFPDFVTGYEALLADLKAKATGESAHHLTANSTMQDLFDTYAPRSDKNQPSLYCDFVCNWMTRALGFSFKPDTILQFVVHGLQPTVS